METSYLLWKIFGNAKNYCYPESTVKNNVWLRNNYRSTVFPQIVVATTIPFFEAWVQQLFKGDNYSKEETINFFLFEWCTMYIGNLNCCRTMYVNVSKSQKNCFFKLHCSKNEPNIRQNSALHMKLRQNFI